MTGFDQPRDSVGRFDEKGHSVPEVVLDTARATYAAADRVLPAGPWRAEDGKVFAGERLVAESDFAGARFYAALRNALPELAAGNFPDELREYSPPKNAACTQRHIWVPGVEWGPEGEQEVQELLGRVHVDGGEELVAAHNLIAKKLDEPFPQFTSPPL